MNATLQSLRKTIDEMSGLLSTDSGLGFGLEQYVLGSTPPAATATTLRDSVALTIGVRRLDLAPYLATPAIVR